MGAYHFDHVAGVGAVAERDGIFDPLEVLDRSLGRIRSRYQARNPVWHGLDKERIPSVQDQDIVHPVASGLVPGEAAGQAAYPRQRRRAPCTQTTAGSC